MSINFQNGFAQGLTVRGIPLLQAYPGKVFWVNNSTVLGKGDLQADSKAQTWANLPKEAKDAAKRFEKDIPGFTRDQFVSEYEWE